MARSPSASAAELLAGSPVPPKPRLASTSPVRVSRAKSPQSKSASLPASTSKFRYSAPPEDVPSTSVHQLKASPPRPTPVKAATLSPRPAPRPPQQQPVGQSAAWKGKGKEVDRSVAEPRVPTVPQKRPSTYSSSHKSTNGPQPAESLLRRLGGPSDQKAGLMRDKEEVRQIIYEASKNSKYFVAQQEQDAQLTVRVDALVARLNRLLSERGGNVRAEQARVDEMIAELEKTRVLTETIVVVDADAFYASCHQREDPSLVGTAFAVGGGVLTTASYEARKYGCSSAMAGFVARKLCPHLKFISLDFSLYSSCSKQIMEILRGYGDISLASLDEAYCSLTDYCRRENVTPTEAAERMRAQVLAETGLSVSAGVSPNAMLSKVAADKNKPNGQCVIDPTPEACMEFAGGLPIRNIPGIGRVSERILQAVGVHTVADVYRLRGELFLVRNEVGLSFLLRAYLGLGRTTISHADRSKRKGISVERTFHPEKNVPKFYKRLENIAEALAGDCEKSQYSGRTITLKLKTHTYQSISRAKTLGSAIYFNEADTFYAEGKKLLDKEMANRRQMIARGQMPKGGKDFCLRLIGLRLSNLRDEKATKDKGKLDGWAGTKSKGKTTVKSKGKVKVKKEESAPPDELACESGDLDEGHNRSLFGDEEDNHSLAFDHDEDIKPTLDDEGDELQQLNNFIRSSQGDHPSSTDQLWAAVGDDVDLSRLEGFDEDSADEEDLNNPIDTTYKPFWTAGESLNSKKQRGAEAPAPIKDRLSFESKRVREEMDEDADFWIVEEEPIVGPLQCPVCEKSFAGSEVALSAHVASHFDVDEKPVKKKVKLGSSSSSSSAKSVKGSSAKPARSLKDMFARR